MSKLIDVSRQKFGRLTVIKKVETPENIKGRRTFWLCKCDCGNEKIIESYKLRKERTISCGCYKKELSSLPPEEASKNKLFENYKRHAKTRNISLELEKKYFFELTKQNCFYCGKEPYYTIKNKWNNGDYIYNGVDRIDSLEGYTKENTVPCCGRCNQAKLAETQSDFSEWIKTVHSNLSNKGLI